MTRRLLMSPPAYLDAAVVPAPFGAALDPCVARRQWDRLVEALHVAADVCIEFVEPSREAPDLTFTAGTALVSGDLAILSSYRHPAQRSKQRLVRSTLAHLGFATTFLQQTYFEGSADALFDPVRPIVYVGYGPRSERGATLQLATILDARILPLSLVDARFYHLDMALCPLGSGHLLAYMDAIGEHAQRTLRRTIDPGYLIELTRQDALQLACNAIEVGDALVLHDVSRPVRERLVAAGYRVFSTDLSEFGKVGAGAKKLALRLDDGPAILAAA